MLALIIGLAVGLLVGWNTTKPSAIASVENKVKSLFAKKAE